MICTRYAVASLADDDAILYSVTGEKPDILCVRARAPYAACGPEAAGWEAKTVTVELLTGD